MAIVITGRTSKEVVNEDAVKFKDQYEKVNGTKTSAGKEYFDVKIDENSPIKYATEEEILNLENGLILFGFPTCPWCRNVVEPLIEFAKENNLTINYLDVQNIRDTKELKDGKVETTKEGTPGYYKILEKFDSILNPYTGLGDDTIKRIGSPTVVFVKEGKAVYKHVSTV